MFYKFKGFQPVVHPSAYVHPQAAVTGNVINDKLTATLKVMNVSSTGDARVAASYAVVVGQIHSADGH